jgi:RNA-directed DNA polymerase
MMHEREKSGLAVVAMKPTNKAERSAAELGEPRAGAEGNVGQHSTDRARNRATVSQGLERIRQVSPLNTQGGEPYAGKPLERFCAGGGAQK